LEAVKISASGVADVTEADDFESRSAAMLWTEANPQTLASYRPNLLLESPEDLVLRLAVLRTQVTHDTFPFSDTSVRSE